MAHFLMVDSKEKTRRFAAAYEGMSRFSLVSSSREVFAAALLVVVVFAFHVAQAPAVDGAAVAGELAGAVES